jgi:hypothetical protein
MTHQLAEYRAAMHALVAKPVDVTALAAMTSEETAPVPYVG